MPTLRERLRATTRLQHERLEAQLQLMRPEWSLLDYRELLERFYAVYAPLEDQMMRALEGSPHRPFFSARLKSRWLAEDLRSLGSAFADGEPAPPATGGDRSELPQVVGTFYVLEGATLGGQVIAPHFEAKLGVTRDCGCRFFTSYGEFTRPYWRSYCDFLEQISSPQCDAAIVTAAVETFVLLQARLCGRETVCR